MRERRPRSRKVRALQAVLGLTPQEIALACRRSPFSYREMAAQWERQVGEAFPELALRFNYNDVYRMILRYG